MRQALAEQPPERRLVRMVNDGVGPIHQTVAMLADPQRQLRIGAPQQVLVKEALLQQEAPARAPVGGRQ